MEISEIIMETFTLGTAIGLNMTHNAASWNRARLGEANFSCFSWYINALVKSTRLDLVSKKTMGREYSSLAK